MKDRCDICEQDCDGCIVLEGKVVCPNCKVSAVQAIRENVEIGGASIREHLWKQQQPYLVSQGISILMFVLGAIGLMYLVGQPPSGLSKKSTQLIIAAVGAIYVIGAVTAITSRVFSVIKLRCPNCKSKLRGNWRKWKFCPFCAVDFDSVKGEIRQQKAAPDTRGA